MMAPLVSIVVPIYKVEAFLTRCVESLLSQTYESTEIILVDDGSPDNCPKMCDDYEREHANVKVVHKPNGGLSSARNAGMDKATGKYIFFVDSDDWLDATCIAELVEIAERTGAQIVRTRMKYANWPNHENGAVCDFGIEKTMVEGLYDREKIEREILPICIATKQITFGPITSACASLYLRELVDKYRFYEDVKYSEDCIFNARLLMEAQSLYYVNERQYYNYFFNNTSITKSFRADRWKSNRRQMERFDEAFAGVAEYDVPSQLWLKRMFLILNALSERKYISDKKERVKYCSGICHDAMTVETMKHLKLVDVPWKLYVILLLIKFKQGWILARV